jgi:hypothetical protein
MTLVMEVDDDRTERYKRCANCCYIAHTTRHIYDISYAHPDAKLMTRDYGVDEFP